MSNLCFELFFELIRISNLLSLCSCSNPPIICQDWPSLVSQVTIIKYKMKNLDKDLHKPQIATDSPKFGTHKAGKYGQPQHKFIKQSSQHPLTTPASLQTVITMSELAKHNRKDSAWISLKGIVYDVTGYIKHHPGGDQLLQGCGRESQKLFNEHHSWVNAKNILANCIIGHLESP